LEYFLLTILEWKQGLSLFLVLSLSQGAFASGLQVNPVTVTIRDQSEIIWLSNVAESALNAQVRVYHWTQDNAGEHLSPTDLLVASPPQLRVEAGGKQLVRLVSAAADDANAGVCEDAYRLTINELPAPRVKGMQGLQYVMQYSIPVFVTSRACSNTAPILAWRLERDEAMIRLAVTNTGNMHAQLSRLSFTNAKGQRTELNPGLLGYVLPGARMFFPLKLSAAMLANGGQIEVMANGAKVAQTLSLVAAASQ
jgi:fimbrial chaperone protein